MNVPKWLLDAVCIVGGSISLALGIVVFIMPHQFASGGPPGIAILVNYLTGISPGLVIFAVNGSLIMLSLRSQSRHFFIRTLAAVVLISLFTDGLLFGLGAVVLTEDRLLSALYAGVLLGLGIGLIYKGGGSSGGWAILARLIADSLHLKVGKTTILLDSMLVLLAAVVFQDYEAALLGAITVFVCGQLIDRILMSKPPIQQVYVSCDRTDVLRSLIEARFGIQGTVICCDAPVQAKALLYLTIDRRHLKALKSLIIEQAPEAEVVVTDVVDMIGSQFSSARS